MSIEFVCPTCQQQLRVPDTAAGKNAKCPKCSTILSVPGNSPTISPLAPPPQAGFDFSPPVAKPPVTSPSQNLPAQNLLTPDLFAQSPGSFAGPPPGSPFANTGGGGGQFPPSTQSTMPPAAAPQPLIITAPNPYAQHPNAANPYASPQGGFAPQRVALTATVGHQIVEVTPVVNYAIEVWKRNLGILMGITLLPIAISLALVGLMFVGIIATAQMKEPALTMVIMVVGYVLMLGSQMWLQIGQWQVLLKLARGQHADIGELFAGGHRILPVLGWTCIAGPILLIAALAFYIPAFVLILFFWPAHFLVIDGKSGVLESFSLGKRITDGNILTTFVLALVSYGFIGLGYTACLVGAFFAIPLVQLIWATAYLMMSGQIPIPPRPQPYYPPQPYPPGQPPGYSPQAYGPPKK